MNRCFFNRLLVVIGSYLLSCRKCFAFYILKVYNIQAVVLLVVTVVTE